MAIEDLKRWHWIVIGLLAGFGLSYAWTSLDAPERAKSISDLGFENALLEPPTKTGEPRVTNVVVHPPDAAGEYRVYFDRLTPTRDGKEVVHVQWVFIAKTPFRPPTQRVVATTQPAGTVLTYLASAAQKRKDVTYTYAWWRTPNWTYAIWTGGAVLLIGGLWPSALNLLIGAGFGRRRREKEPEYDLSRFGKGEPDAKTAAKPAGPTEDDLQRLREIEAKIESSLGSSTPPDVQPPEAPPPPRPLDAGPLQPEPAPRTPEQEKDYRGEYYPTARAKKKE